MSFSTFSLPNKNSHKHSFLNNDEYNFEFSNCKENNTFCFDNNTDNTEDILISQSNRELDIINCGNELDLIPFGSKIPPNNYEYYQEERQISQNIFSPSNNILESKNKNNDVNKNDINNNLTINKNKKEIKNSYSKKEILFKTENPNKSLIFDFMKIDDEYIKDILNSKNVNTKKRIKSKNYSIKSNERKKKIKNIIRRKDNTDNIRMKIITLFFKILKININKKIKSAGSKRFFKTFPRKFISKFITRILNAKDKKEADLTFHDIFSKNFCEEKSTLNFHDIISKDISENKEKEEKLYKLYRKNYKENLEVLNYLEGEKVVCEKIKFNQIKNLNFSQMFKEFLNSPEFLKKLYLLKNEDKNYYGKFIIKSREILNYF